MSHIAPVIKTDNARNTPTTSAVNTEIQLTQRDLDAAAAAVDKKVAATARSSSAQTYQEPIGARLWHEGTRDGNGFKIAGALGLLAVAKTVDGIGSVFSFLRYGPSTPPETAASNIKAFGARAHQLATDGGEAGRALKHAFED